MGTVSYLRDGLINLVSKMGTTRDKSSQSFYSLTVMTSEQLRTAYRGSWLPKKIVNIPAQDAVRKWRDWSAQAIQITAIEAEEKRLGIRGKVKQAQISARLFGGSAILIGTGEENLSEPLDVERIKKGGLKYVTVLDKRDLTTGLIDYAPASENFGKPTLYNLATNGGNNIPLHPSRLVIFVGAPLPESGASRTDVWGDSVLQSAIDAVKQADGTNSNIAALVFEAKVDTIGIPNLTNLLKDPRNEQKILDRLALAETAKGINQTLLHDADEIIGQKQLNFSQLPDLMDRFFQNVSGAADIPLTRLFGTSPEAPSEGDRVEFTLENGVTYTGTVDEVVESDGNVLVSFKNGIQPKYQKSRAQRVSERALMAHHSQKG